MVKKSFFLFFLFVFWANVKAQVSDVFDIINLNYHGLENVRNKYLDNDTIGAKEELLRYFRNKIDKKNKGKSYAISSSDQKKADNALEHKFYAMGSYPSYFYGKDIDWTYWPVKDHELRFQLHRFGWFVPLGKAYQVTKDEKYAKALIFQYKDWLIKNKCPSDAEKGKYDAKINSANLSVNELLPGDENAQFAWRPLEASGRLTALYEAFSLIINSKQFTPDFFALFLKSYDLHANYVITHLTKEGNHLLIEADNLIFAGSTFPEMKNSEKWRRKGIEILCNEIDKQVYDDGVQYELDPGYHRGTISSFLHGYQTAADKGYANEFPKTYLEKIEKMMIVTMNMLFPDYRVPHFSDAGGMADKVGFNRLFEKWSKFFPDNQEFRYFVTDGKEGNKPKNNSKAFINGGFFIFRNGWDYNSTVMMLKAGPPAEWHNQPDNGTFDLYINGRHFISDSGRYIYGGDSLVLSQRNWFRQTRVHNTLTLDGKNIETTNSKCLLWDISNPACEILSTENQGYKNLKHRRTVFFIDKSYFIIIDEAIGSAVGTININYQLGEDHVKVDKKNNIIYTDYADGNNIKIEAISDCEFQLCEREGWISYDYGKKNKRYSYSYDIEKEGEETIRFISVISPASSYKMEKTKSVKVENITDNKIVLSINNGVKNEIYVAKIQQ